MQKANLLAFLYGTSMSWTSPVLSKMSKGEAVYMSPHEISWMVSILYIGNFISPLIAGKIIDTFGRKKTMIATTVLVVISWTLLIEGEKKWFLYIFRFLLGFSNGIILTVTPIYSAEIAETKIRGSLISIGLFMFMGGMFVEFMVGPHLPFHTLNVLNIIPPITILFLLVGIPETPHWYVMKNRNKDAIESLAWLRNKSASEVKVEMSLIEKEVQDQMKQKFSYKEILNNEGYRRALITLIVVCFCNRLSGISSNLAYASTTLPHLDWATPDGCVSILGAISFLGSALSFPIIDKVKRKSLLLFTLLMCAISMFAAALWYYYNMNARADETKFNWIPALSVNSMGFFYSLGFGPLSIIFQAEYFPVNTRGSSSAIASATYALSGFIANFSWKYIEMYEGVYVNYLILTAANLICFVYAIFFIIETKGKTLQEIQDLLGYTKDKT